MNFTWDSGDVPPLAPIGVAGWLRVGIRGGAMAVLLVGGLVLLLALRGIERPIHGLHRPWTAHVPERVSRAMFRILGMRHEIEGRPMRKHGAVVANHSSWLDIFALNARKRIYFVSKSEVAGWPGIGTLARCAGTVFISRDPREARAQTELFEARLLAGHRLLFFPEGTSTDGFRVLPFRTTLFQAFYAPDLLHDVHIQPVSVIYSAPEGADPRFYGWWGDMDFAPHLLAMLAARRHGAVRVVYHDPVRVDGFDNRKALAAHVERIVRVGMPPDRQAAG
ncbi:lyso-ornithine lipid acyltransferase [Roseovarius halotolerans]|uniref:2-acyl-glycerophospho-ethanolamine acyltransferase n=1 Tax=Roseovarius halotolerans TaxID=505353 RepID=A0A1X6YND2_9RHOB|nr:lyso-ornithine lipid acyltransferase [Roseovarius halotolerans]SLN26472.1 2-acyl-glycerophospho-ethanolamine acyltransferase [Roseovarius halotolerans]